MKLGDHVLRSRIRTLAPNGRWAMKIASGKVEGGKIIVEGDVFAEGSTVTVLSADADDESFDVTPEEEAELLEAIGQIQAGEFVDGHQLLKELRDKA